MSTAMVCGKRSYFEEECESSPLVTKKLRCSCLTVTSSLLLEKALQENDNDVDSVIRSFTQLCLGCVEGNSGSANAATGEEYAENSSAHGNVPVTNCSQQQIEALTRDVALKEQQQETKALMRESVTFKEHQQQTDQALTRENVALKKLVTILMRGVVSKHEREKDLKKEVSTLKQMLSTYEERQKDYDNKTQEVEHLKKEASRWKGEKYALNMRLKQAEESNSMHGRFHRDVF
ncbi:hypothetical protein Tco_1072109 [Tanacetum coccineum]